MLDILLSNEKTYGVELDYWKAKLEGVAPLLLTTDFNRASSAGTHRSSIKFTIDPKLAGQLSLLSKEQDASLFSILFAAYNVLLYRYSSQEDICIGNLAPETEILSANILALRSTVTGEDVFTDLLNRVKNTTLEAQQNQKVPFETVINTLFKENKGRNPL